MCFVCFHDASICVELLLFLLHRCPQSDVPVVFLLSSLTASVSDRSPTDALRSAMMYPYRVGVAKILVLVPCWCRGDLGDLASVLQSHGFVLHVLQEQPLMVAESSNNSPSKVFGECGAISRSNRIPELNSFF